MSGGTTTTYGFSYDATGKRIVKRIGILVNTVYVGAHFEVANGMETSYIFAGAQRVAKVTGTATRYFHQDHLGSATRVTDETGALVEQAEYLPFGEMRASSSQPPFASNYKYTDQEMDVGTGLYNYDARMYDPIIGRFISPDSIVPDPTNPQALNRYSYVLNNPLRYVDPTGNEFEDYLPGGRLCPELPSILPPSVPPAFPPAFPPNPTGGFLGFIKAILDFFSKDPTTGQPRFLISEEEDPRQSAAGRTAMKATELSQKVLAFLGLIPKTATQDKPASTPVGRSGAGEMKVASKNPGQTIGGREYAGHAIDDMQARGVPPSAVESIIKNGNESPGRDAGTKVYTSSEGRVVMTDEGKVISVVQFGPKGR